jgi:hypothetical protein
MAEVLEMQDAIFSERKGLARRHIVSYKDRNELACETVTKKVLV